MRFCSQGHVEDEFEFQSTGTYRFTVQAYGQFAGGAWPFLELRVDGLPVAGTSVNTTSATAFTLTANVAAGVHRVAVAFVNDYWDGVNDRNLFVDNISVAADGASGGTATLVQSLIAPDRCMDVEWGIPVRRCSPDHLVLPRRGKPAVQAPADG